MVRKRFRGLGLIRVLFGRSALLAGTAALVLAGSASAATIKVTTKKDEFGPGGTPKCALREALQAANTDKRFGGCPKGKGADEIVLGRGTYALAIPVKPFQTFEDANANGDLDSRANVRIRGRGRDLTTIDGNAALLGSRILERVRGNLTVARLTLRNGFPFSGLGGVKYGGAIASEQETAARGTLALLNVTVEDNRTEYFGGGVSSEYGSLVVRRSRVTDNFAGDSGGGIFFFANEDDDELTIARSVIAGNRAAEGAGGVHVEGRARALIDRTVVRDNGAYENGGGLYLDGESVKVKRSTISGNHDYRNEGGGIYIASAGAPVVIESTTIAGNHAAEGGGGVHAVAPAVLRNVTITGNYSDDDGGGIEAVAPVTLQSSTIARNVAKLAGGGLFKSGGTVRYRNSIIARNRVLAGLFRERDCAGAPATSLGHNLLGDGTCASVASDVVGTSQLPIDPRLGSLGDNGGPTQTLRLLAGSPAINKGQGCPKRDQRGRKRKGRCDIGAFER